MKNTVPRPGPNLAICVATLVAALNASSCARRAAEIAPIVVMISGDTEWLAVRALIPEESPSSSPFGEWFSSRRYAQTGRPVRFFHGGWGKIAAASSTQFAIDQWRPALLINLGTCGGFAGAVQKQDIILVDKTIVYDIGEQIGDAAAAIREYSTDLDLSFLDPARPVGVTHGPMVSADRDLLPRDVPHLAKTYGASAGDWESGAIAWVAQRNRVPVFIARGVSDLVSDTAGDAYGNVPAYEVETKLVMQRLLAELPAWIAQWERAGHPAR